MGKLILFCFHLYVYERVNGLPNTTPLIKHLSFLLKWTTRSSSKTPLSDGNVLQFENGYLVETVVEGNALGVVPFSIRVSEDGELFVVDALNSNIVRSTPPLSQCKLMSLFFAALRLLLLWGILDLLLLL
ncbi:unnamed protein product [Ilex paraguariensis]|uniref:Uncharacterized protein n=1 Tax=Ilex paraguariensis TaxID=185542 RepID=A0ABC8RE04_9AQUA